LRPPAIKSGRGVFLGLGFFAANENARQNIALFIAPRYIFPAAKICSPLQVSDSSRRIASKGAFGNS
jgi:hypothetical protein